MVSACAATLSVIIVGEQQILIAGVQLAIEADGLAVVGVAKDPRAAEPLLNEHSPDLCVVLAPMSGETTPLVSTIRELAPSTAVVVLSADDHLEGESLLAVMTAGADGWLSADMPPHVLGRTLRAVHRGEPGISRQHVARLLTALRRPAGRLVRLSDGRSVELTSREHEMLDLMKAGMNTESIAQRLNVSPATVRWHIARLMKKLDVRTRQDAVALAQGSRRAMRD